MGYAAEDNSAAFFTKINLVIIWTICYSECTSKSDFYKLL